jgi:hypothetical protein
MVYLLNVRIEDPLISWKNFRDHAVGYGYPIKTDITVLCGAHRFRWPRATEQIVSLRLKELEWLLAGLDYAHAHEHLNYRFAS